MERNYGWFRLAERLHMSLDECMEKHTEEQAAMWDIYFTLELNRPGRLESYLMRVTAEIYSLRDQLRLMFAKKGERPSEVSLDHFRVTFGDPEEYEVVRVSKVRWVPEKVAAAARSRWVADLGTISEKRIPKAEGESRKAELMREWESWRERWN